MKKRSRLQNLRETIFGTPEEVPIVKGEAVIGRVKQIETHPEESFNDQVDLFNNDPVVKEKIQGFAEQVISTGIFTTMNEKYTLRLPDGNGGDHNAKESVDEWNRKNDIDTKMLQIAVELDAFGNSVWMISDTSGLVNVPIESIFKAISKTKDIPIRDIYDLVTTATYGSKVLKSGTFKHFRINITGSAPFGYGICSGLVAVPDADTPSLYDIRKSVRASMKTGFEKFSFGNVYIGLPGLSDDKITEIGTDIAAMSDTGNRIVSNTDVKVGLEVPQRTQSYDKWIEQIDKEFYMATGGGITPDTQFTTKATAEAVAEAYKFKVSAFRRIIKREIESLWDKVLKELGFDPIKANVKLHFGSVEIEYITGDVFTAVDKGIVTKDEARTILREYMKWRLEGDLPKEKEPKIPEVPKIIESLTESKPSKQEVDLNININHEPIRSEATIKIDPINIKTESIVKTEPLLIKNEPSKIEVEVKSNKDPKLEIKKLEIMNKLLEKVK